MNRPAVVGIFAHPDDESMGPGGTIAKLAKTHDVYLICATQGEKGGSGKNLGKRRYGELLKAGQILGVKQIFGFKFPDGGLAKNQDQNLTTEFEAVLKKLAPQILITFEPRGLTGHPDHITITKVCLSLFNSLPTVQKLMLYCMSSNQRKLMTNYFISVPPGYSKSQVDLVENVNATWAKRKKAIACHQSQKSDVERVLTELDLIPAEEYFLIHTK